MSERAPVSVSDIGLATVVDQRLSMFRCFDKGWIAPLAEVLTTDERDQANFVKWLRTDLQQSTLWWVAPTMCSLLDHAARSMPPHQLHVTDVPDPFGLVFFGSALTGIDARGSRRPMTVNAISWGVRTLETGHQGIGIYAWALQQTSVGDLWTPLGGPNWWLGEEPTCDEGTNSAELSAYEDCHRLAALWRLAASPGITTTSHERASRASARRSSRAGVESSALRVVRLRRLVAARGDSDADADVAWTHRWMVSGHWRQHWYPSLNDHRPVWIAPYVKGPEGLPLVVKDTVKALVR